MYVELKLMDNLEDVEDLTSLWNFDEYDLQNIYDLKKQLQYAMNELVDVRKEVIEQAKINKENIKKLIHLLGIAYKERDDAKDQLHKLLMAKSHTLLASLLPTTVTATRTSTMISETKKNVLTSSNKTALPTNQQPLPTSIDLCWNHSLSNAPIYPMMIDNNFITTNYSNNTLSSKDFDSDVMFSSEVYNTSSHSSNKNNASSSYDQISTIMNNLAQGKPRPENGKLLQSLMEASPILDSLLVAGPLSTWLCPPQALHAPQVPPISMSKRPRYNESLEC